MNRLQPQFFEILTNSALLAENYNPARIGVAVSQYNVSATNNQTCTG